MAKPPGLASDGSRGRPRATRRRLSPCSPHDPPPPSRASSIALTPGRFRAYDGRRRDRRGHGGSWLRRTRRAHEFGELLDIALVVHDGWASFEGVCACWCSTVSVADRNHAHDEQDRDHEFPWHPALDEESCGKAGRCGRGPRRRAADPRLCRPARFLDVARREPRHSRGVWLRLAKKASGTPSVTYAEAIGVALAWGWIDGQKRPGDETSWLQKFSARGARSTWSKINRDKATALLARGRRRPAGRAALRADQQALPVRGDAGGG
jgi:hypothetical protein